MTRTLDTRAVVVQAFPRLHFGLIDLGRATPRAYGGSGVTLQGRCLEIAAYQSLRTELRGFDVLDAEATLDVREALDRLFTLTNTSTRVTLALRTPPLQHIGLGSKTALVLACLTGASEVLGHRLDSGALQRLSGRGGTSGVGIHGFFAGGLIFDAGRPQVEVPKLLPSGSGPPLTIPYRVARAPVPRSWRFCLLLPAGPRIAGREEAAFFRASTPIPEDQVLQSLAYTAYGLVPAIAAADLPTVRDALTVLHSCGFKQREVAAQSAGVRSLLRELRTNGFAAGLSSMGPLVFTIDDDDRLPERIMGIAERADAEVLGRFHARNAGAECSIGQA